PQPSRGGACSGRRAAPRRAIHRRNRPVRQWLFPRQGRPRETDQGLRHPLHHHPLDPVPGIPRRHRRFKYGWKHSQDFARLVSAHRVGRRCSQRCRCGARGAAKQHRRDRRPGTSTIQRNRRPLSEGARRPAPGRERPRGSILRRPGRRALARAVGRDAPRPHRSRRMAPPLTGSSLIPDPPTEGGLFMKRILCSLLVAPLPFGGVLADAPKDKNAKVTLVYQHELPNCPGKSIKGVLVEYGPGGYSPAHTHAKSAFIYATVLEGAIRSQVNEGLATTYTAGQNFSELPGDRHVVSANASETNPAKLGTRSRPLPCSIMLVGYRRPMQVLLIAWTRFGTNLAPIGRAKGNQRFRRSKKPRE